MASDMSIARRRLDQELSQHNIPDALQVLDKAVSGLIELAKGKVSDGLSAKAVKNPFGDPPAIPGSGKASGEMRLSRYAGEYTAQNKQKVAKKVKTRSQQSTAMPKFGKAMGPQGGEDEMDQGGGPGGPPMGGGPGGPPMGGGPGGDIEAEIQQAMQQPGVAEAIQMLQREGPDAMNKLDPRVRQVIEHLLQLEQQASGGDQGGDQGGGPGGPPMGGPGEEQPMQPKSMYKSQEEDEREGEDGQDAMKSWNDDDDDDDDDEDEDEEEEEEEEEDDDDDDEDEDEEDQMSRLRAMRNAKKKRDMGKSYAAPVRKSSAAKLGEIHKALVSGPDGANVAEVVEASKELAQMVDVFGRFLADISTQVEAVRTEQYQSTAMLANAVSTVVKSQAAMALGLERMAKSAAALARQGAEAPMQKSMLVEEPVTRPNPGVMMNGKVIVEGNQLRRSNAQIDETGQAFMVPTGIEGRLTKSLVGSVIQQAVLDGEFSAQSALRWLTETDSPTTGPVGVFQQLPMKLKERIVAKTQETQ